MFRRRIIMRNVKYGLFQDFEPSSSYRNDDNMLIGGHAALSHERSKATASTKGEFYTVDEKDHKTIISEPTNLEQFFAKLKYTFNLRKKKIVGYRSDSGSDLTRVGYGLGKEWNEETESWVQDRSYYETRGYDPDANDNPWNKEEHSKQVTKEELEDLKEKVLNIGSNAKIERDKALAETLSSQVIGVTDSMQRRREERYQEMIDELPPVESPMDRRR